MADNMSSGSSKPNQGNHQYNPGNQKQVGPGDQKQGGQNQPNKDTSVSQHPHSGGKSGGNR
jgi:hypothetical protein